MMKGYSRNTNQYLTDNVGKQPFFSSKDIVSQEALNSKKLEKELEDDAKRNEHQRHESLQDIKNDVIKTIYKWLLPFILILMVLWAICCWINALEVKAGIEWLFTTIISLFVGTLIGKFI